MWKGKDDMDKALGLVSTAIAETAFGAGGAILIGVEKQASRVIFTIVLHDGFTTTLGVQL